MTDKIFKEIGLRDLGEVADFLVANAQNRILALYGDMGMGKTTLSRILCDKWKVIDEVSSPTFSIVNEYKTSKDQTIYHFDFYRIKSINEALDMGCEEYFYSGNTCIIEWPEKIEDILPEDAITIHIDEDAQGKRRIEIKHI